MLLLHYFFLAFHTAFTLFNCTGWIWKKTRTAHIITMSLTAVSWFVLGIRYGWGYCVCTDWHWQILYTLERPPASRSYIHYLIVEITGFNLNEDLVIKWTLYIFLGLIVMTVGLNLKRLFVFWNRKHGGPW